MSDVTRILAQIDSGDPAAAEQLLPLVYDELRKLAAAKLAREKPGLTLQATALVHEAYLRLVGQPDGEKESQSDGETKQSLPLSVSPSLGPALPAYNSRGYFFAAAAEAMRRILIENARRKNLPKHGGGRRRIDLDEAHRVVASSDDLLLLDDALDRLATEDPAAVEIVKLRLFAGLSVEQAADALGLARATAYRHWTFARAWLRCELGGEIPAENL